MKNVQIQDLMAGLVDGIEVQLPSRANIYKETYFEWTATSLISKVNTSEISGDVLKAWHYTPVFSEIETHIDTEMFYYISGVSLMLFIDIVNGKPHSYV